MQPFRAHVSALKATKPLHVSKLYSRYQAKSEHVMLRLNAKICNDEL
jgi:hypothetical protein